LYESTIPKSNIKKHISAERCLENGLPLLSEKYRYKVVGAHDIMEICESWNFVNRHTYQIEFCQIKPMASTIILDSTQGHRKTLRVNNG
jgi:hypothetical protein